MEALMILILLTFSQPDAQGRVEISYEAKLTIMTMDRCRLPEQALAEDPPKGKTPIVICVPSKETRAPEKKPMWLDAKTS